MNNITTDYIPSTLPKVAVLLPTYNGSLFLKEQLESILNLSGITPHIFINDDGSSDQTIEIINKYRDRGVTLIEHKKCGGAAQNFFYLIITVPLENFDYICFSDQDDVWFETKISRAIKVINSNNFAAYSSDVTGLWPDGSTKYICKSQPQRRIDYIFEAAGPGNTYVFPRKYALQLKSFLHLVTLEKLKNISLHDWMIYSYFRSQNLPWVIDSVSGLNYRQHSNNVLGAASGMKAVLKRTGLVFNGWYLRQIILQADILNLHATDLFAARFLTYLETPRFRDLVFVLRNIRECRRKWSDAAGLSVVVILRYLKVIHL